MGVASLISSELSFVFYPSSLICIDFMANNKPKKRGLVTDSNVSAKKNKGQNSLCPVCEASFKAGQESIFCEGESQKYVHRQCAGLT